MKNPIVKIAALAFITGTIWIGCATPAEKVEDAEKGIAQANKDLAKAQEAYELDIADNKKLADMRANANDSSIAHFRSRIAEEKKETRADYEKKIAELDRKNKDLKKEMDDYKADGKDGWEKFKKKFDDDMTAFGESFRRFTEKRGQ
jgi:hypothetical protein